MQKFTIKTTNRKIKKKINAYNIEQYYKKEGQNITTKERILPEKEKRESRFKKKRKK